MLDVGIDRPLPTPSWLTEPFWDAAGRGTLVVQRCVSCHRLVFRPEYACPRCLDTTLEWVEASGKGAIHSYSIVRHRPSALFPPTYVVVCVEWEEGWHMMSNLVGCDDVDVCIGLQVQVQFHRVGWLHLPFVVPRDEPAPGGPR